jgi:hypothetical protein
MQILADWLNSIPAVIWSGGIGALIAASVSLLGVWSANKSSLDRLRAQHIHDAKEAAKQRDHDAQQKEADRKAAIRREIYTKAAEEAHAVFGAVGGLPERPLSTQASDTEPLHLFLRAFAKVWLVAEADTAHLSREFVADMSELFLKALAIASPIRVALAPLLDLDKQIVHTEGELARITTSLNELRESSACAQAQLAASDSWTRNQELVMALRLEKSRLLQGVRDQRFAYVTDIFNLMSPVQRKMVSLISMLRGELNLPPDEGVFLAQHIEAQGRAWALVCNVFGKNINESEG